MNNKLKKVHIFEKVWLIGKSNKSGNHAVIYGPDKKEYDLTRQWIDYLHTHDEEEYENINDRWNLGRVKIYILSQIIDPGEWIFDIEIKPSKNRKIKVIYKNGTIVNIDSFSGDFDNHKLEKGTEYPQRLNPKWLEWHREIRSNKIGQPQQYIWEKKTIYKKVETWKY